MIKKLKLFYCLSMIVIMLMYMAGSIVESGGYQAPDCKKTDLKVNYDRLFKTNAIETVCGASKYSHKKIVANQPYIFSQNHIKKNDVDEMIESDYEFIFEQTGLGKPAVDALLESEEGYETLLRCQDNYFSQKNIICTRSGIVSCNERFRDENGKKIKGFEIVSAKEGDIFVSLSSHSMGFRHGHAGIVVCCDPLMTLEAETIGRKSGIITKPGWESCTTFLQLRLKEKYGGAEKAAEAAAYAKESLLDINYGLFCDKEAKKTDVVNCAFIVWKAYEQLGLDIDSNSGRVVLPEDFILSDYFDIVQSFGFSAEKFLP